MSIYDTLNPMQKEAVLHTDGPLLILAGAGSGKTRVLTHRVAYLIDEKGVNPWNILAITFTNKAADEMRDRVDRLVGFGSEEIWVATFHSTCVRILRRHIDRLGYDNHFTIYDADDQKRIAKQVIKTLDLDPKLYKERTVIQAISSAKNEMITPDEMETNAGANYHDRKLAEAYREYEKTLRSNNALDFDDLLMKTVELLRNHLDVLDYYQNRFRYIMVDEYQDTNNVQFQLIELLAKKYRNICVVGDDDQSIYKFRGADITNILSFEQQFPNTKVIRLEQNYRSTQPILDTANEIISNNVRRKEKRLWTDRTVGDPVKFHLYSTGEDEASSVIGEIRRLVRADKARYSDCAVLYRTNAQSRSFEEACVRMNVPYRLIGGVNFYQRAEIKDILSYLKTISNGRDDLAVHRILNVPKRGIGQTTEDKVQMFASEHGMNFYDALAAASQIPGVKRAQAKIEEFVALIREFRKTAEELQPDELIREIIEKLDYTATFDDLEEDQIQAKKQNLEELVSKASDFAAKYEANGDADRSVLSAFLEEVALVSDIDSLDAEQDRMILMTLHGAKGLEFPRVYMTGMEEGLFPSYMSIGSGDPDDIEEERRLCYVGVTRAKNQLTLTAARFRTLHGESQANALSRFVNEIPDSLVDKAEAKAEKKFYSSASPRTREEVNPYRNGFGGKTSSWDSDTIFDSPKKTAPAPKSGRSFSAHSVDGKGIAGLEKAGIRRGKDLNLGHAGRPAAEKVKVGDRVSHVKFGEGTVTGVTPKGSDNAITIMFDNETYGRKILLESFNMLKKI